MTDTRKLWASAVLWCALAALAAMDGERGAAFLALVTAACFAGQARQTRKLKSTEAMRHETIGKRKAETSF